MGVFTVPVILRSLQNKFLPPEKQGKEVTCEAMADTGAHRLALPAEAIERLKLGPLDTVTAYTADGSRRQYRVFGIVELEVQGRKCQVRAVELPFSAEPLLGAIPLEEMDWHVSSKEKRLLPNPKSPDRPLVPLV